MENQEQYPKIYKSSIINIFIAKIILIIVALLFFKSLSSYTLIIILVFAYVYLGFTNNDIHIYQDKLVFVNRLFFFKREYLLMDIEKIRLKHEWSEKILKTKSKTPFTSVFFVEFIIQVLIPIDYKYIKLIHKDGKSKKMFCFGFDYASFNSKRSPLMEVIFADLESIHKDVLWTKNNDPDFQPCEG